MTKRTDQRIVMLPWEDLRTLEPLAANMSSTGLDQKHYALLRAAIREAGEVKVPVDLTMGKAIIDGVHRWSAAMELHLPLPAIIHHISEEEAIRRAIQANVLRRKPGPDEILRAVKLLMDIFAVKQGEPGLEGRLRDLIGTTLGRSGRQVQRDMDDIRAGLQADPTVFERFKNIPGLRKEIDRLTSTEQTAAAATPVKTERVVQKLLRALDHVRTTAEELRQHINDLRPSERGELNEAREQTNAMLQSVLATPLGG
ncbi:MAG: ParB N-terminal domain-containing protein [Planctomycetota bacterium]